MRETALKFIVIILSLAFLFILPAFQNKDESDIPLREPYPYPLLINGLSVRVNKNGIPYSRMQADEFHIMQRKFLFFNIAAINEAVLTNAKIEIFLNNNPRIKNPNMDLFEQIFNSFTGKGKVTGLITRITINRVSVKIYNSGILTHRLEAVSAGILNNSRTVFHNVEIEHPPTRRIMTTDMMIWNASSNRFIIPGRYKASSPLGKAAAKGLEIDLNFDLSPLRETIIKIPKNS